MFPLINDYSKGQQHNQTRNIYTGGCWNLDINCNYYVSAEEYATKITAKWFRHKSLTEDCDNMCYWFVEGNSCNKRCKDNVLLTHNQVYLAFRVNKPHNVFSMYLISSVNFVKIRSKNTK